jgi:hypothetical protein
MLSRSDQSRSGFIPPPGNEATHPHGYAHGDGGAGGPLDSHPQGPSGIDRLYSKYKASIPGMSAQAFAAMVKDISRSYSLSSSDIDGDAPLHKGAKSTIHDRVAAQAAALKLQHPDLSHDDCVSRVLDRNKLTDAYNREKKI